MIKNKNKNSIRTRNIFDPKSKEPFKLSRSKIDLFLECERCFYFDRRLGIARPPGLPFTLNSAVDFLLKKEFDIHRAKNEKHPLMEKYGIEAVPFQHKMMDEWRDNFKGVQFLHRPTNFLVTGAVDDIWADPKGQLIVVDYKATSTANQISMDDPWRQDYKRQVEVYQWLLRQNGFTVSPTAYFVYANGRKDKEAFDGKLEFDVEIIPYQGNDKWVQDALIKARQCLDSDEIPAAAPDCPFCNYRQSAKKFE